DPLRVIARRRADHPGAALLGCELRELVRRAADLVRPGPLEELGLQQDAVARLTRERRRSEHGRPVDDRRDPPLRRVEGLGSQLRDRIDGEPAGHAVASRAKMPSISTEMSNGSAAMPTAERACAPRSSPNAATIRSEAPFATSGCWAKSGAELTMTSSL